MLAALGGVLVAASGAGVALASTALATYVTGGDQPFGIALSADGTRAVIGNAGGGTITVLDLDPASPTLGTVLAAFPTSEYSLEPVASPLDGLVYAGECAGSGSTYGIDTATLAIVHTVPVPGCFAAVSPDGARVFLAVDAAIHVLDVDPGSVGYGSTSTIPLVGYHYGGIAVSPDGLRLYSIAASEQVISVIDVDPGSAGYGTRIVADVAVGPLSLRPSVSPDGSRVVVPDLADGQLRVYDDQLTPIATVPLGTSAGSATYGPDGLLSVTMPGDDSIVRLDPATFAVVETWSEVGSTPAFVVFGPGGAPAYVTNSIALGALTVVGEPAPAAGGPSAPGGGGGGTGGAGDPGGGGSRGSGGPVDPGGPVVAGGPGGTPPGGGVVDPSATASTSLAYTGTPAVSGLLLGGAVLAALGAGLLAAHLLARHRVRRDLTPTP